jgi:cell division protein FtsW
MLLRHWIPFFDTTAQDWGFEARVLRWLTFVWILLGLVVVFSASYPAGSQEFQNGWHYLQRQVLFVVIGMVIFNWIVHSPLRIILGYAHWGLLLFLSLIWLTAMPGYTAIGGASRWIPLGPFLLQPSEFIKPFLVLQSARIFGQWDRLTWKTRFTWLGAFALALLGILIQPNLSTTALCGITIWLVALAAGLPGQYLLGTGAGGILLATISITFREYQRKRVMSFLNPWADASGDGYQLTQSLMAIGSGGIFGTGYGQSAQKIGFLPIQYCSLPRRVWINRGNGRVSDASRLRHPRISYCPKSDQYYSSVSSDRSHRLNGGTVHFKHRRFNRSHAHDGFTVSILELRRQFSLS